MSQGPEEGQAAVPVGGGRAQPGFKIDHSKPYAHETHAVPVGGGRAWPGFETTRRATLACGDLADGPSPTGTNTQTQTLNHKHIGTTKPPGPTGGRAAHASGR